MTAGGKRPGAGPKLKYGEPTVNLVVRVPKSKKAAIKKVVLGELEKYLVKKKVTRLLGRSLILSINSLFFFATLLQKYIL